MSLFQNSKFKNIPEKFGRAEREVQIWKKNSGIFSKSYAREVNPPSKKTNRVPPRGLRSGIKYEK
jgi:hypothetical protein